MNEKPLGEMKPLGQGQLQVTLVALLEELTEMAYNMEPTACDHAKVFMALRDQLAWRVK